MKSRSLLKLSLIVGVLSLLTIPVWARPNSKDNLHATIQVMSAVSLGDKTLQPGEYDVFAQNNNVQFKQDGKLVAEAPYTMKTLPNKAQATEFFTDHDHMTQIQVAGKTEAIDLTR